MKILRLIWGVLGIVFCWHEWEADINRTPPVGMKGEKCTAKRTRYWKVID